jgi:HEAT repeat protein
VLSHYARLVLERIGSVKSDAALLAALESAPDAVKPGIMGSLGVRRDANAVKPLGKLAVNSDPAVAAAAIGALGRIGGTSAAGILRKLKPAESLAPVHTDALLDCARSLTGSRAAALYEQVLAGKSLQRVSALGGLLAADEKKAVALMVGFVKGDDAQMFGGVLTLVCGEKSAALTKAMADVLATLPDAKKAALITALGARGDTAALGGIAGCVTSTNELIRTTALMALGKIGNEDTVKLLLATGGSATEALAKMSGDGVNATLIQALADNKLKGPAIKALVARSAIAAVPVLFKLLDDPSGEVRKAVWNGLGSLAAEEDITQMAKVAFAIKDEEELLGAIGAVRRVCAQARDKAKCFETVASYYDSASDRAKEIVLDMASFVGNATALATAKKALGSSNKELHTSGVRSLAAWCNQSAAVDLLALAKSADKENERILALRGYIRIAGMDNVNLNEDQRAEMCKTADGMATRADEKKMIIGSLQRGHTAIALTLMNKYLDDPELRNDAEGFAANIADHRKKEGPAAEVKEIATKLLTSKDKGMVERATKVLAEMAK